MSNSNNIKLARMSLAIMEYLEKTGSEYEQDDEHLFAIKVDDTWYQIQFGPFEDKYFVNVFIIQRQAADATDVQKQHAYAVSNAMNMGAGKCVYLSNNDEGDIRFIVSSIGIFSSPEEFLAVIETYIRMVSLLSDQLDDEWNATEEQ
ncbi:MAG: hypothetical protein MR415_00930 [Coriobacteriaceae bacterium]|nr:hypothetical protein [Coriobacteriaceae bacterium]